MKKSLISLAIAAGMAVSGAALAEDAAVYGIVHLSINDRDTGSPTDEMEMTSNTSALGVKGSEDLGDGMKALYLIEFQLNADEAHTTSPTITGRDQWVGLKGGMGTIKFGTMSSNYKQMGGKVDPLYRTQLEGRGFLKMQSNLHGGGGIYRGRSEDTLQYSSPKMGGMQLVVNTTFSGATDPAGETTGIGFRYDSKDFLVYVDMISMNDGTKDESSTKIGGTFKAGPVKIGAQLEQTEDWVGRDYMTVTADYKIDGNNAVKFAFGTQGETVGADNGSTGVALMYAHNLSKQTDMYVGYGDRSDDAAGAAGESMLTLGMRKKF